MPKSNDRDVLKVLDAVATDEATFTIERWNGNWTEVVERADGTVETRVRSCQGTRTSANIKVKTIILIVLAGLLIYRPDLVGRVGEILGHLLRSG